MGEKSFKGYSGKALSVLQKFNAPVWSDVELITSKGNYKGIILPRSETADDLHVVLKMQLVITLE